ncbi:C2 family cysteine protease [Micromonospora sp. NPDC049559]|uniref:C2 family cysteine protease n=1 Tax=Micromonospora sp. NPDC049559 TaxID=3155923 RepID=UPI0034443116
MPSPAVDQREPEVVELVSPALQGMDPQELEELLASAQADPQPEVVEERLFPAAPDPQPEAVAEEAFSPHPAAPPVVVPGAGAGTGSPPAPPVGATGGDQLRVPRVVHLVVADADRLGDETRERIEAWRDHATSRDWDVRVWLSPETIAANVDLATGSPSGARVSLENLAELLPDATGRRLAPDDVERARRTAVDRFGGVSVDHELVPSEVDLPEASMRPAVGPDSLAATTTPAESAATPERQTAAGVPATTVSGLTTVAPPLWPASRLYPGHRPGTARQRFTARRRGATQRRIPGRRRVTTVHPGAKPSGQTAPEQAIRVVPADLRAAKRVIAAPFARQRRDVRAGRTPATDVWSLLGLQHPAQRQLLGPVPREVTQVFMYRGEGDATAGGSTGPGTRAGNDLRAGNPADQDMVLIAASSLGSPSDHFVQDSFRQQVAVLAEDVLFRRLAGLPQRTITLTGSDRSPADTWRVADRMRAALAKYAEPELEVMLDETDEERADWAIQEALSALDGLVTVRSHARVQPGHVQLPSNLSVRTEPSYLLPEELLLVHEWDQDDPRWPGSWQMFSPVAGIDARLADAPPLFFWPVEPLPGEGGSFRYEVAYFAPATASSSGAPATDGEQPSAVWVFRLPVPASGSPAARELIRGAVAGLNERFRLPVDTQLHVVPLFDSSQPPWPDELFTGEPDVVLANLTRRMLTELGAVDVDAVAVVDGLAVVPPRALIQIFARVRVHDGPGAGGHPGSIMRRNVGGAGERGNPPRLAAKQSTNPLWRVGDRAFVVPPAQGAANLGAAVAGMVAPDASVLVAAVAASPYTLQWAGERRGGVTAERFLDALAEDAVTAGGGRPHLVLWVQGDPNMVVELGRHVWNVMRDRRERGAPTPLSLVVGYRQYGIVEWEAFTGDQDASSTTRSSLRAAQGVARRLTRGDAESWFRRMVRAGLAGQLRDDQLPALVDRILNHPRLAWGVPASEQSGTADDASLGRHVNVRVPTVATEAARLGHVRRQLRGHRVLLPVVLDDQPSVRVHLAADLQAPTLRLPATLDDPPQHLVVVHDREAEDSAETLPRQIWVNQYADAYGFVAAFLPSWVSATDILTSRSAWQSGRVVVETGRLGPGENASGDLLTWPLDGEQLTAGEYLERLPGDPDDAAPVVVLTHWFASDTAALESSFVGALLRGGADVVVAWQSERVVGRREIRRGNETVIEDVTEVAARWELLRSRLQLREAAADRPEGTDRLPTLPKAIARLRSGEVRNYFDPAALVVMRTYLRSPKPNNPDELVWLRWEPETPRSEATIRAWLDDPAGVIVAREATSPGDRRIGVPAKFVRRHEPSAGGAPYYLVDAATLDHHLGRVEQNRSDWSLASRGQWPFSLDDLLDRAIGHVRWPDEQETMTRLASGEVLSYTDPHAIRARMMFDSGGWRILDGTTVIVAGQNTDGEPTAQEIEAWVRGPAGIAVANGAVRPDGRAVEVPTRFIRRTHWGPLIDTAALADEMERVERVPGTENRWRVVVSSSDPAPVYLHDSWPEEAIGELLSLTPAEARSGSEVARWLLTRLGVSPTPGGTRAETGTERVAARLGGRFVPSSAHGLLALGHAAVTVARVVDAAHPAGHLVLVARRVDGRFAIMDLDSVADSTPVVHADLATALGVDARRAIPPVLAGTVELPVTVFPHTSSGGPQRLRQIDLSVHRAPRVTSGPMSLRQPGQGASAHVLTAGPSRSVGERAREVLGLSSRFDEVVVGGPLDETSLRRVVDDVVGAVRGGGDPGPWSLAECVVLVNSFVRRVYPRGVVLGRVVDDLPVGRGGVAGVRDGLIAGSGWARVGDRSALWRSFEGLGPGATVLFLESRGDEYTGHARAWHRTTDGVWGVDPQREDRVYAVEYAAGESSLTGPWNGPDGRPGVVETWAIVVDGRGRVVEPDEAPGARSWAVSDSGSVARSLIDAPTSHEFGAHAQEVEVHNVAFVLGGRPMRARTRLLRSTDGLIEVVTDNKKFWIGADNLFYPSLDAMAAAGVPQHPQLNQRAHASVAEIKVVPARTLEGEDARPRLVDVEARLNEVVRRLWNARSVRGLTDRPSTRLSDLFPEPDQYDIEPAMRDVLVATYPGFHEDAPFYLQVTEDVPVAAVYDFLEHVAEHATPNEPATTYLRAALRIGRDVGALYVERVLGSRPSDQDMRMLVASRPVASVMGVMAMASLTAAAAIDWEVNRTFIVKGRMIVATRHSLYLLGQALGRDIREVLRTNVSEVHQIFATRFFEAAPNFPAAYARRYQLPPGTAVDLFSMTLVNEYRQEERIGTVRQLLAEVFDPAPGGPRIRPSAFDVSESGDGSSLNTRASAHGELPPTVALEVRYYGRPAAGTPDWRQGFVSYETMMGNSRRLRETAQAVDSTARTAHLLGGDQRGRAITTALLHVATTARGQRRQRIDELRYAITEYLRANPAMRDPLATLLAPAEARLQTVLLPPDRTGAPGGHNGGHGPGGGPSTGGSSHGGGYVRGGSPSASRSDARRQRRPAPYVASSPPSSSSSSVPPPMGFSGASGFGGPVPPVPPPGADPRYLSSAFLPYYPSSQPGPSTGTGAVVGPYGHYPQQPAQGHYFQQGQPPQHGQEGQYPAGAGYRGPGASGSGSGGRTQAFMADTSEATVRGLERAVEDRRKQLLAAGADAAGDVVLQRLSEQLATYSASAGLADAVGGMTLAGSGQPEGAADAGRTPDRRRRRQAADAEGTVADPAPPAGPLPETIAELQRLAERDSMVTNVRLASDWRYERAVQDLIDDLDGEVVRGRTYAVLPDADAERLLIGDEFLVRVSEAAPESVPDGHRLLVFDSGHVRVRHGEWEAAFVPAGSAWLREEGADGVAYFVDGDDAAPADEIGVSAPLAGTVWSAPVEFHGTDLLGLVDRSGAAPVLPDGTPGSRGTSDIIGWIRYQAAVATSEDAMRWFQPDGAQQLDVVMELVLPEGASDESPNQRADREATEENLADWLTAGVNRQLNFGLVRWSARRGLVRWSEHGGFATASPRANVTYSIARFPAGTDMPPSYGLVRLRYLGQAPVPAVDRELQGQRELILDGRAIVVDRDPRTLELTERAVSEVRALAADVAARAVERYYAGQPGPEVLVTGQYDEAAGSDVVDADIGIDAALKPFHQALDLSVRERLGDLSRREPSVVGELTGTIRIVRDHRPMESTDQWQAFAMPVEIQVTAPALPPAPINGEGIRSRGWRSPEAAPVMEDPVPATVVEQIASELPESAFGAVRFEHGDVMDLGGDDQRLMWHYVGAGKYDVARVMVEQVDPDSGTITSQWVRIFRHRLHLTPDTGVHPETVERFQREAIAGVRHILNEKYQLPGGDQFHVLVEFVDEADAHQVVLVRDGDDVRTNVAVWPTRLLKRDERYLRAAITHEIVHVATGALDDYEDTEPGVRRTIFRSDQPGLRDRRVPHRHELTVGIMGGVGDEVVHLVRARYLEHFDFYQRSHSNAPETTVRRTGNLVRVVPESALELRRIAERETVATNARLASEWRYERAVQALIDDLDGEVVRGRTYAVLPDAAAGRLLIGDEFLVRVSEAPPESVPDGHRLLVFDSAHVRVRQDEWEAAFVPAGSVSLRGEGADGIAYFTDGESDAVAEPPPAAEDPTPVTGTLWREPVEFRASGLGELSAEPDGTPLFFGDELRRRLRLLRRNRPNRDLPPDAVARTTADLIDWTGRAARAATGDEAMRWFQPDGRQRLNVVVEVVLPAGPAGEPEADRAVREAAEEGLGQWLAAVVNRQLNVGLARWGQRQDPQPVVPRADVRYSIVRTPAGANDPRPDGLVRLRYAGPVPEPSVDRELQGQRERILDGRTVVVDRDPGTLGLTERAAAEVDALAVEVAARAVERYLAGVPGPEVALVGQYDQAVDDPDDAEGGIHEALPPFRLSLEAAVRERLTEVWHRQPAPTEVDEVVETVGVGRYHRRVPNAEPRRRFAMPVEFHVAAPALPPRPIDGEGIRSSGWRGGAPGPRVAAPLSTAVVEQVVAALPDDAFRPVAFEHADVTDPVGDDRRLLSQYRVDGRYDVARVRVERPDPADGPPLSQWVRVFRLRLHLAAEEGVSADTVGRFQREATIAIQEEINERFQLPDGDQFHLLVEFVDSDHAHHVVTITGTVRDDLTADDKHWPEALLDRPEQYRRDVIRREILQGTGLYDRYRDQRPAGQPRSVFRGTAPGARGWLLPRPYEGPWGLMGTLPRRGANLILASYLEQIDFYQRSHANAPETTMRLTGDTAEEVPVGLLGRIAGEDPAATNARLADDPRYGAVVQELLDAGHGVLIPGTTYAVLPDAHAGRLTGGAGFPLRVTTDAPEQVPDGQRLLAFDSPHVRLHHDGTEAAFIPAGTVMFAEETADGTIHFVDAVVSLDDIPRPGGAVWFDDDSDGWSDSESEPAVPGSAGIPDGAPPVRTSGASGSEPAVDPAGPVSAPYSAAETSASEHAMTSRPGDIAVDDRSGLSEVDAENLREIRQFLRGLEHPEMDGAEILSWRAEMEKLPGAPTTSRSLNEWTALAIKRNELSVPGLRGGAAGDEYEVHSAQIDGRGTPIGQGDPIFSSNDGLIEVVVDATYLYRTPDGTWYGDPTDVPANAPVTMAPVFVPEIKTRPWRVLASEIPEAVSEETVRRRVDEVIDILSRANGRRLSQLLPADQFTISPQASNWTFGYRAELFPNRNPLHAHHTQGLPLSTAYMALGAAFRFSRNGDGKRLVGAAMPFGSAVAQRFLSRRGHANLNDAAVYQIAAFDRETSAILSVMSVMFPQAGALALSRLRQKQNALLVAKALAGVALRTSPFDIGRALSASHREFFASAAEEIKTLFVEHFERAIGRDAQYFHSLPGGINGLLGFKNIAEASGERRSVAEYWDQLLLGEDYQLTSRAVFGTTPIGVRNRPNNDPLIHVENRDLGPVHTSLEDHRERTDQYAEAVRNAEQRAANQILLSSTSEGRAIVDAARGAVAATASTVPGEERRRVSHLRATIRTYLDRYPGNITALQSLLSGLEGRFGALVVESVPTAPHGGRHDGSPGPGGDGSGGHVRGGSPSASRSDRRSQRRVGPYSTQPASGSSMLPHYPSGQPGPSTGAVAGPYVYYPQPLPGQYPQQSQQYLQGQFPSGSGGPSGGRRGPGRSGGGYPPSGSGGPGYLGDVSVLRGPSVSGLTWWRPGGVDSVAEPLVAFASFEREFGWLRRVNDEGAGRSGVVEGDNGWLANCLLLAIGVHLTVTARDRDQVFVVPPVGRGEGSRPGGEGVLGLPTADALAYAEQSRGGTDPGAGPRMLVEVESYEAIAVAVERAGPGAHGFVIVKSDTAAVGHVLNVFNDDGNGLLFIDGQVPDRPARLPRDARIFFVPVGPVEIPVAGEPTMPEELADYLTGPTPGTGGPNTNAVASGYPAAPESVEVPAVPPSASASGRPAAPLPPPAARHGRITAEVEGLRFPPMAGRPPAPGDSGGGVRFAADQPVRLLGPDQRAPGYVMVSPLSRTGSARYWVPEDAVRDGAPPVTDFAGEGLYGPSAAPVAADVSQGSLGDCYLMSALGAMVNSDPTLITDLFTENADGTVDIAMYLVDDGDLPPFAERSAVRGEDTLVRFSIRVDRRLYTTREGGRETVYAGGTPLWPALIEKAFAVVAGGYAKIAGGYPRAVWQTLVGRLGTHQRIGPQSRSGWFGEGFVAHPFDLDVAGLRGIGLSEPDARGFREAVERVDAVRWPHVSADLAAVVALAPEGAREAIRNYSRPILEGPLGSGHYSSVAQQLHHRLTELLAQGGYATFATKEWGVGGWGRAANGADLVPGLRPKHGYTILAVRAQGTGERRQMYLVLREPLGNLGRRYGVSGQRVVAGAGQNPVFVLDLSDAMRYGFSINYQLPAVSPATGPASGQPAGPLIFGPPSMDPDADPAATSARAIRTSSSAAGRSTGPGTPDARDRWSGVGATGFASAASYSDAPPSGDQTSRVRRDFAETVREGFGPLPFFPGTGGRVVTAQASLPVDGGHRNVDRPRRLGSARGVKGLSRVLAAVGLGSPTARGQQLAPLPPPVRTGSIVADVSVRRYRPVGEGAPAPDDSRGATKLVRGDTVYILESDPGTPKHLVVALPGSSVGYVVQEKAVAVRPGPRVANFAGERLFGPTGRPEIGHLRQGDLNDCFLLAALGSMVHRDPSLITNSMSENADGTVTVHLYRFKDDGRPPFLVSDVARGAVERFSVRMNRELYVSREGQRQAEYAAADPPWPGFIERAFATVAGGYRMLDEGGWAAAVWHTLLGVPGQQQQIGMGSRRDRWRRSGGRAHPADLDVAGLRGIGLSGADAESFLVAARAVDPRQQPGVWADLESVVALAPEAARHALREYARPILEAPLGSGRYSRDALDMYDLLRRVFKQNGLAAFGTEGWDHKVPGLVPGLRPDHAYTVVDLRAAGDGRLFIVLREPAGDLGRGYRSSGDRIVAVAETHAVFELDLADAMRYGDLFYYQVPARQDERSSWGTPSGTAGQPARPLGSAPRLSASRLEEPGRVDGPAPTVVAESGRLSRSGAPQDASLLGGPGPAAAVRAEVPLPKPVPWEAEITEYLTVPVSGPRAGSTAAGGHLRFSRGDGVIVGEESPDGSLFMVSPDGGRSWAWVGSGSIRHIDVRPVVADFSDLPMFGSAGRPELGDVHQGALHDCFLLAAAASTARNDPDFLRDSFAEQPDGTVLVRLHRRQAGGAAFAAVPVRVDKRMYTSGLGAGGDRGTPLYARSNVLWPMLLEKACASVSGGYRMLNEGGKPERAFERILGRVSSAEDFNTSETGRVVVARRHPFDMSRRELMELGMSEVDAEAFRRNAAGVRNTLPPGGHMDRRIVVACAPPTARPVLSSYVERTLDGPSGSGVYAQPTLEFHDRLRRLLAAGGIAVAGTASWDGQVHRLPDLVPWHAYSIIAAFWEGATARVRLRDPRGGAGNVRDEHGNNVDGEFDIDVSQLPRFFKALQYLPAADDRRNDGPETPSATRPYPHGRGRGAAGARMPFVTEARESLGSLPIFPRSGAGRG